ncbi:hypothetical protein NUU61_001148 [Penicillium alfredii]|uniref:Xylanolytic transcriptional activator regulatory domain-containing protein n=1 Tax=Penicillium alfredii TaxID=1506179 RepID=A0A9W9GAY2_9EURO|nr:uncharacterized protein NUU61_001148 [Penicillium alfredii]KAJ5115389.1 hypothetical protein NUU61_001148 [Penicillium alfredii]
MTESLAPCTPLDSLGSATRTPRARALLLSVTTHEPAIDTTWREQIERKRSSRSASDFLWSPELEEQIEALGGCLRTIEGQLASQKGASEHRTTSPVSNTATTRNKPVAAQLAGPPVSLYEGDSSFTSQSAQARDVAETFAGPDESNLNGSFDSLKTLLRPASQDHRFSDTATPNPTPMSLPLPAELVLAILRSIQVQKPMFLWSHPINDTSLVERICQKVYFPTRTISPGDIAAMHGVLYFLIREYILKKDPLCDQFDLETHLLSCKQSFYVDIEKYDVWAVPSFENIIALIIGILKAQDEAKPLLGCHLVATAARHCQMLGYHRESTYLKSDERDAENKRRLFWTIYVFDKNMSLILGRTSYIQDFDIDVRLPTPSSDPAIRPWDEIALPVIRLAGVQGEIYDKHYSARALKRAPSEPVDWAISIESLDTELIQCRYDREQVDSSTVDDRPLFDVSQGAWDVVWHSTRTTLLRASSTVGNTCEIGSRCFESARLSLQSHLRCFSAFQKPGPYSTVEYANWVLLYSSLTPFIVIFLHAIAATSIDDVLLLDDVVATLHHTRAVSSACERLYKVCETFARVARGLVEARKPGLGKYNQQEDSLQLEEMWKASGSDPDSSHDFLGVDMMDYLTYPEAQDISALLNSWDGGQPSAMEMLGMGFGDSLD